MNKKKRLEYLESQIRIEPITQEQINIQRWFDGMDALMKDSLNEMLRVPMLNDSNNGYHRIRNNDGGYHWIRIERDE